jgi:hypothetical protein
VASLSGLVVDMSASPAQILAAFDAMATERSINLEDKAYGAGAATWSLPHAGIPTFMVLSFNGLVHRTDDVTGGTVTPSPFWPYNVQGVSSLVDYAGVTRIAADGWDLHLLELVKNFGAYPDAPYGSMSYAASVFTAAIPAAKGGGGDASGALKFSVIVPISYLKASALGSYAATVPDGASQYQLKENAVTGSTIASPLAIDGTHCTAAWITGTWSLTYYFLDAPSTVEIPAQALKQIHEVYHEQSTENLIAGAQNVANLLTGRTYYRVIQTVCENNTASFLNLDNLQFIVDGSTPALDERLQAYLARVRFEYGRDLPPGVTLRDFTMKPWTPDQYGSLAVRNIIGSGFTPGSFASVTTLRETLFIPSGNLVGMGAGA